VVVEVLLGLGGAASWRMLRQHGVGWYALRLALADGDVIRLRRGAFALPDADRAMRAAIALGGLLACTSAAASLGLPVLFSRGVHVVVPRGWSHARLANVRVHRRDIDADERAGLCTSLLRTVVDCARELPLREAVVICDAATRAGLDLVALADQAQSARGNGSRRLRMVLAHTDPSAESPIESCLRLVARRLGEVEAQVRIPGVGRVDLVVDRWLVLEADGFAFHSDRESYREDRRRWNALVAAGYTVLRFSYEDVVHHEERTEALIAAVLSSHSHSRVRER
jgi:very-short-patch-repair endonuclease